MTTSGSRRLIGVAILGAALVLTLAGCGGLTAPTSSPTTPQRSLANNELRPLTAPLRDAFASGGALGFFVEGDPSTSDAMDLYQTAWWAAAAPSDWRTRLARRRVGAWARDALYLRRGASGAPYGSLDQVSLALQLVTLLHVAYEKGRVQSELEKLYLQAKNTGAAVTALSVMARLSEEMDVPLPGRFERVVIRDAGAILSGRGGGSTGNVLAVLSALPSSWATRHQGPLRVKLKQIIVSTSAADDVAQALSVRSGLLRVLQDVRLRWRIGCSHQFVRALREPGVDPHLVALAEANGCGHFTPPPMSPLGWPTQWSVSQSLASSVDGYRLAIAIGTAEDYRQRLVMELKRVWLPEYLRGSDAERGPAALIGLYLLRSLLRVHIVLPRPVLPQHWTLSATTGLLFVPALLLSGDEHALPSEAAVAGRSGVTYADILHFIFLCDHSRSVQRDAVASLRGLRWNQGVVVGPNALWETILADWAKQSWVSPIELHRAGLCDATLHCFSQRSGQRNLQPWLQVAGAVAALEEPAAYSIPSPYL